MGKPSTILLSIFFNSLRHIKVCGHQLSLSVLRSMAFSQGEEGSYLNNPGILAKGGLRKRTLIFLPWGHCVPPLHVHSAFMVTFQFSSVQFSSAQSLSRVRLFATPWIAARQASLSITNSWSLFKLMPIKSVMPSSHLILCCPLLLLPPIPPSIRVFSNESTLHMRWPKYCSFSFSVSPSNEHPGLISFSHWWTGWISLQSKGLSRVFSDYLYTPHIPERD